MQLLSFSSIALATVTLVNAGHLPIYHNGHHLSKRAYSGQATFWDVEDSEVACGGYYKHTQSVVALNFEQYGNPDARSSFCGKTVKITYQGKSKTAVVVDACEACGYGGLDMSTSLFNFFEDPVVGLFHMSWTVVGADSGDDGDDDSGDDDEPKTTSKAKPKTTSSKEQPTTSYKPKPTTTSKYTPPPEPTTTSTKSSSTVISTSASLNSTISGTTSGNSTVSATGTKSGAKPTGTGKGSANASYELDGVLNTVNQFVLGMAGLSAQLAELGAAAN
ncbi:hypothetical protein BT69DRAFT_1336543 [Atractiella rhizophila]|nr:hypothetical protein BT69DRAFT_1336543 [Atractiella rhizophila]